MLVQHQTRSIQKKIGAHSAYKVSCATHGSDCPYQMTTLNAPNGVTRIGCTNAYATKLHTSPTTTTREMREKVRVSIQALRVIRYRRAEMPHNVSLKLLPLLTHEHSCPPHERFQVIVSFSSKHAALCTVDQSFLLEDKARANQESYRLIPSVRIGL